MRNEFLLCKNVLAENRDFTWMNDRSRKTKNSREIARVKIVNLFFAATQDR